MAVLTAVIVVRFRMRPRNDPSVDRVTREKLLLRIEKVYARRRKFNEERKNKKAYRAGRRRR